MDVNFHKIMLFWFYKSGTQNESADVFLFLFGGHILIYLFSGSLGEIWASLGEIWTKMVLEVSWFEEVRQVKCDRFILGGSFSLEVFRESVGKFGQNFFAPPKICLLQPGV